MTSEKPCHDHPWRYIERDDIEMSRGDLDQRWCPECGAAECSEDGNRWFT